jgi:hypothetical protein
MTFPLDANAAAPGWYHAPGDPDGTVRYWNGTDWIGFPTRDPAIWLSVWVSSPISASSVQTVLSHTAIVIGLNVTSVLCILLTVIQTASCLAKRA